MWEEKKKFGFAWPISKHLTFAELGEETNLEVRQFELGKIQTYALSQDTIYYKKGNWLSKKKKNTD